MIRFYHPDDTRAIIHVWQQASSIAHPFLNPDFLEKEAINIRDVYLPNTKTWVWDDEGHLKGFISMIKNEVGAIFVSPEQHGEGIGTKLMNTVVYLHDELMVEVFTENKIGRKFYIGYGFKEIKRHIHEETGNELILMKYFNNH